MEALATQHPGLSKTEAIQVAVRAYLREQAVEELRSLAGSFPIEDVSEEFRAADWQV